MLEFNTLLHLRHGITFENKVKKAEEKAWRKPWRMSLLMKLLGKTICLRFLRCKLEKIWKPKGKMNAVDIENEYFVVQFSNKDDYEFSLFEGPCD